MYHPCVGLVSRTAMDYPGISQVVLCIYIVYCICDTLEYPRVFLWIRVRVRGRVRAGLGLGCPNLSNLGHY